MVTVTIERFRSMTVVVTLTHALTEYPTQGGTHDLRKGIRQDSVPEES
jgi:hypothetical protein